MFKIFQKYKKAQLLTGGPCSPSVPSLPGGPYKIICKY
jgi:hypothetical protein